MKIYTIKQTQFLPISMEEAWDFFSSPKNLTKITPGEMEFNVIYISGNTNKTYAGQIIQYTLKILGGIRAHWTTEITHVNEPFYFVDEQRYGPYALWHHQHFFKTVEGGVEMTDEVNYAIPFGIFGRLANALIVAKELNRIFTYRLKTLERVFPLKPSSSK